MAELTGSEILARALKREGIEDIFYLMGGPMLLAEAKSIEAGIRAIDMRHEQAAAMAAHAYTRLRQRPAVCMAASGPGVINLATGLANALIDCAPVVALGGSSPVNVYGRQAFQEIDQMAIMEGCVKYAARVYHPQRIPEMLNIALRQSMAGKPGPVYLDLPGDVLYQKVAEDEIDWSLSGRPIDPARIPGDAAQVRALVEALGKAERPVVVSGSGVIWSRAWEQMRAFVEAAGIPFYTTPQGRGVIPEDHALCYPSARSQAFREADLVIVVGTRLNYIVGHLAPPRFAADAVVARIDIDAGEMAASPRQVDIPINGDAGAVLDQLRAAVGDVAARYQGWRDRLAGTEASKRGQAGDNSLADAEPIHPLRLLGEIADFAKRDAILVVDGQETLNYGRRAMPTHTPGHRLNSGPFGTMGVGLPLGLGAAVAKPDCQVIVVHGDGSFGLNAMELDTAVRHKIPLLVVICNNGGWTADEDYMGGSKPGRHLGFTRYDRMAEALGCYGDYVEKPGDIRAALERAQAKVDEGMVAVVNVKVEPTARAATQEFAQYST
jgi:thiamine pyrophosphate-dependent acetolactate synthase large subunit-like protein